MDAMTYAYIYVYVILYIYNTYIGQYIIAIITYSGHNNVYTRQITPIYIFIYIYIYMHCMYTYVRACGGQYTCTDMPGRPYMELGENDMPPPMNTLQYEGKSTGGLL